MQPNIAMKFAEYMAWILLPYMSTVTWRKIDNNSKDI